MLKSQSHLCTGGEGTSGILWAAWLSCGTLCNGLRRSPEPWLGHKLRTSHRSLARKLCYFARSASQWLQLLAILASGAAETRLGLCHIIAGKLWRQLGLLLNPSFVRIQCCYQGKAGSSYVGCGPPTAVWLTPQREQPLSSGSSPARTSDGQGMTERILWLMWVSCLWLVLSIKCSSLDYSGIWYFLCCPIRLEKYPFKKSAPSIKRVYEQK